MIFAIEEINNSSSLLPNISVGYKVFDSCGSTLASTRAVMGLMNGEERTLRKTCSSQSSVQAIIGASESSSTIVMLQMCGIFQIPVVNICKVVCCFFCDHFTKGLFTLYLDIISVYCTVNKVWILVTLWLVYWLCYVVFSLLI